MSRQTTTLRYILESKIGLNESVGYDSVKNVIAQGRPIIFDFDYPIFDPAYKGVLETKFLRHFYTREIGVTPFGKWKLWLEDEMNILMPYYNQLYQSATLKFDPLKNTEQSRVGNKKDTGNRKDVGNSSSKTNQNTSGKTDASNTTVTEDNSMDAYQDTPQSSLTGVESLSYLTNARQVKRNDTTTDDGITTTTGTADSTGSNEFTSTNDFTNLNEFSETIFGKVGDASYSAMLNEFRSTFLNIDQMLLKDLSQLFMGIYSGGEFYD